MKQKCSFVIVLFLMSMAFMPASGEENTRRFSQSWPVKEVETLRISNKYGEVKVNDAGGDVVTVDVLVKVDGAGSKVRNILEAISVNFGKSGSVASAETNISSGFRGGVSFTIDYTVNIPAGKNLVIRNKFGNVILGKLTGIGEFEVAYGNFAASQLAGPSTKLNLAYGKAEIEELAQASVSIAYSKMFIGAGKNLELESKYSTVNGDKAAAIRFNSKYDTFNFGELESLEGESKFTDFKISLLTKKLRLESGYGNIKVERVPASFESIEVTSGYARVFLGIEENASYNVDAACDYCNITYPKEKFRGNKASENTRQSISGKVGQGTGGSVKVTSRYGNINLVK